MQTRELERGIILDIIRNWKVVVCEFSVRGSAPFKASLLVVILLLTGKSSDHEPNYDEIERFEHPGTLLNKKKKEWSSPPTVCGDRSDVPEPLLELMFVYRGAYGIPVN